MKAKTLMLSAVIGFTLLGGSTVNAMGHAGGHAAGHATGHGVGHTTHVGEHGTNYEVHTGSKTHAETGAHFNENKGYGIKRAFPEYHSNGLNPFQTWWLLSRNHKANDTGFLIVKDVRGKSHKVKVPRNVYKKWRNRGRELVYKQGHVYQIKDNHRIV